MLPPVELDHFHGAIRSRRRSVVDEQSANALLDDFCILLAKAGLFCQLNIDRALQFVQTEPDKMLLYLRVGGSSIALLIFFTIDTLRDLLTADLHR